MSKVVLNEVEIGRALTRISYEILEKYDGISNLVLVGVKTRGFFIAERIAKTLEKLEGKVEVLPLDVKQYRDDYQGERTIQPSETLKNKTVVLVDDVLYTGRTIRASLDAIMDQGRPQSVSLAILVDRGHRELPIRPDFVGKNIPTASKERVKVNVLEVDNMDQVYIEQ